jgi:hypothetical protein
MKSSFALSLLLLPRTVDASFLSPSLQKIRPDFLNMVPNTGNVHVIANSAMSLPDNIISDQVASDTMLATYQTKYTLSSVTTDDSSFSDEDELGLQSQNALRSALVSEFNAEFCVSIVTKYLGRYLTA